MDGGKIVADGTHAELMESVPLYVEVLAQGEQEDERLAQEALDGAPPNGAGSSPLTDVAFVATQDPDLNVDGVL